jgi:hypothetical protein
VERSLEAEALALERPRETQLRHIAPRISQGRGVAGSTGRRAVVETGEESGGGDETTPTGRRAGGRRRSFCLFSLSGKVGLFMGPFCPSDLKILAPLLFFSFVGD